MIPCIVLSLPPKFQPSAGDSGVPVLSKRKMVCPDQLVTQTFSCASRVNPNPGPASPPPLKPNGLGESALPLGANFDRFPAHSMSWFCAPTMKLSAIQALPSPSSISLPGPLNPPPVNLSGKTHALGANVRYGRKGVGRNSLPGSGFGWG